MLKSTTLAAAILIILASSITAHANTPGADFTPQVKELYRVTACGGDEPVPSRFDAKVVAGHCQELRERIARYRKRWVDVAAPVLHQVVPTNISTTVIYPFGGGDLLTALATFPNATEITTLSLERAGDARLIDKIAKEKFKTELDTNRKDIEKLFAVAHSKTTNLSIVSRGGLPGELVFVLTALTVHEQEPLSLRYFRLDADGKLTYITDDEIAAADAAGNARTLFANMEITFRARGQADAPVRTYRHISANLDDKHLKADPSVIKYLESKGEHLSAMTKAASYLLWFGEFSTMREYLLAHVDWMISDSTGIPPHYARKAGFEQITYGTFDGPFLNAGKSEGEEFKKLWSANPHVNLSFRYGYPDSNSHSHMMVTRRVH